MKKLLTVLLTVLMVCGLVACSSSKTETESGPVEDQTTDTDDTATVDPAETEMPKGATSYADFLAADVDTEVEIVMGVQAHQGWYESDGQGKVTIYGADEDGGYLVYNAYVDETTANALAEGVLIKVTGYKAEFEGEVEIAEGATVELYSNPEYVSDRVDVTDYIGTDELESYMNWKISMHDLTVTNISYKDSEYDPDIYIECTDANGNYVNLCVENYLTGPDTEVYQTASSLEVGALINIEGFLYWYQGANPHVTSITSTH